jgi:hypothetical protein
MQTFLAEPYRVTNVVPGAANVGDRRVEAFRQRDGKGLINAFGRFARSVLARSVVTGKSIDRGMLYSAYSELFRDYVESFEGLISCLPEQQLKGKASGPGGTVVDLEFAPTAAECKEEDVRSSLRLQLKTMKDLAGFGFSPHLVDEVETDFHRTLAEG